MLTLPLCGTPVCVPYFCSLPYLEEVLWNFVIWNMWSALRRSTERVQNTQVRGEAAAGSWGSCLPGCPWVKMRFVSPRELNFILLFLMTMIWIDFIRNWYATFVTLVYVFLSTVSPQTPRSFVLVDMGMVEILGEKEIILTMCSFKHEMVQWPSVFGYILIPSAQLGPRAASVLKHCC